MASRIILDTSALVAIVLLESGSEALFDSVLRSDVAISAPNLVEAHLVLRPRLSDLASASISRYLSELSIAVLPFGEPEFSIAAEAFDRFGKGRHPARLNYGDCMAYAASRTSGRPLLFVGDDFARTDVDRVRV